ncbi:MAG: response regulator [Candidatus Dadabacteria bacterium]|nr:MAG: response regulator [Candidatus Dadabacteria bacterium]
MPKVLIVDDSAWARALVRQVLEGTGVEGLEILEAGDGEDALEVMVTERPGFVVLDLVLPGMRGEEVLAKARAAGFDGTVVVLTADVQESTREALAAAGADGFVTKPLVGAAAEDLAGLVKRFAGGEGKGESGG